MSSITKIIFITFSFCALNVQADTVSELEQLVNRWLLTERQVSALEKQAIEQKSSMQQSLTLLDAEYQQLNQVSKHRQKNGDDLAQQRADLVSKQETLEQDQQQLIAQLSKIDQRLMSLKAQLPPPLLNSWQAAGDLSNEQLETTDRLQITLKLIRLLSEFQQRISLHEMAISHPDGHQVWVTQLYLGASQAWFVSKDMSYVGVGFPTALGWQWQFDNTLNAEQVAKAIAIFNKQKPADWVKLPIIAYSNQVSATSAVEH